MFETNFTRHQVEFTWSDAKIELAVDSGQIISQGNVEDINELELEQYDILLEEQVYPFEDSAIDIHEQNASRAWDGLYDKWVKKSFSELRALLPGRYAKDEAPVEVMNVLQ